MILDFTNLSVVTLSINAKFNNYSSNLDIFSCYRSEIYSSIKEVYNYMEDELYYLDTNGYNRDGSTEDIKLKNPYSNRSLKEYLVDPMSRFYVASQSFSDYRPYFSSYIESPRKTHIDNFYYSMILILLGKKNVKRLKTTDSDVLKKYLEEDRQEVLDIIRVEKATVASLTLSRYLEERELAKRIGEMTMNM